MKDYSNIDTKALTIEDALADDYFDKLPTSYFEFIAIDSDIVESIHQDFTIEEAGEFLKAVADYCCNGNFPDMTRLSTSAVKFAVRNVTRNHDRRMNAEYLRHYRQFVTQQQKLQKTKPDT